MRLIALTLLACALTAPARAGDELRLLLDWFVNPNHMPMITAEQRGFFADEGLDVEMIEPADPNAPPKLVAAGEAELAISYQPALHLQIDAGLPLVRIATLVATPLNMLVALEDGPIAEIADLKGRTIGYSVGGFETALLGAMLKNAGLSEEDIELVNVNFSLSPALMSGRVDAVIGAFRNFELNQLRIEGRTGRGFPVEAHGAPPYDELILVAHRDRLGDDRLPRFIAAIERAILALVSDPAAGYADFIAFRPDLDDDLNRAAYGDTLPTFARRPSAIDAGRYDRFAAFLQDKGLIGDPPPADSYLKAVR